MGEKVNITREEYSGELTRQAMESLQEMQDQILLLLAARIEQIRKLTPEELRSLAASAAVAKWISRDLALIRRAIEQQNRKYQPIIAGIINSLEAENYEYMKPYLKYRKKQITREFFRSGMAKRIEIIHKEVLHDVLNVSHTYAYAYGGKVSPVGATYRRIVNKAITSASIGTASYDRVVKQAIDELAESGIKTVQWKDGKEKPLVRRADAHIRMNLMEGINRVNAEMQKEAGKAFGADGVEISMHTLCAPDHQPVQGRQYSNEEYAALNANLKRPIGTLNCRHIAFPIIMGISKPIHSEEERIQAIQRSNSKVKYNGREMTRYDASQGQRRREREIRIMRSEAKAYEKAGLKADAAKINREIKERIKEYHAYCNAVGMSERMDRTRYYI